MWEPAFGTVENETIGFLQVIRDEKPGAGGLASMLARGKNPILHAKIVGGMELRGCGS